MKITFARALGLAGAMCLPGWSQAASGLAAVQNLRFELIDLASDDGVTPSLMWDTAIARADVSSAFDASLTFSPDGLWSISFLNSGSSYAFNPESFSSLASASFAGASAAFGNADVSAQFQTLDGGNSSSASSFSYGVFTLSPMTTLRITGTLSVGIQGPTGSEFAVPPGTPVDFAALHAQSFAYARIQLSPLNGGSSPASFEAQSLRNENYTPSTDSSFPVGMYDESVLLQPFSLQMVNDADSSATGEFRAQADVAGQQIDLPVATAVPEPQTWLMLGAGVLLAAGFRTRRHGHAARSKQHGGW